MMFSEKMLDISMIYAHKSDPEWCWIKAYLLRKKDVIGLYTYQETDESKLNEYQGRLVLLLSSGSNLDFEIRLFANAHLIEQHIFALLTA